MRLDRSKRTISRCSISFEYDQKSGAVVLVADVAAAVGKEYSQVRTRLLAIPAEQAPRIHRLKTVTEVQDVLQELITEALEELVSDGRSLADMPVAWTPLLANCALLGSRTFNLHPN